MIPTVRLVLLTALRDRLFVSFFVVLAFLLAVSLYLGSAAVVETRQASLVYAAGSVRAVLVLGLGAFVAFHTERLYESREIEALLSRPLTRITFVLAYWAAIGAIAVVMLLLAVAAISALQPSHDGVLWWSATTLVEALVVIAFAVFCGLSFERAIPTIFATVAFYALARLVGFFVGIAEGSKNVGVNKIANPMMEYLSYVFPRLDLAGQTEWLVYGIGNTGYAVLMLGQGAVYIVLLLAATAFDLQRKQF